MIERIIKLHIGEAVPKTVVECTEGDTMWEWHFQLFFAGARWTIPAGSSATFCGLKKDGNVFDLTATVASNEVVIGATEQITAVAGDVYCVVRVIDTYGKIIASCPVVLRCKPNPQSSGVLSDTVLSAYDEALQALGQAVADLNLPQNVADWLDEHITQPTTPVVDTSLSVSGAAADAAVTGGVKSNVDNLLVNRYGAYVSQNMLTSESSLTSGYMQKNGNTASSSLYSYTDYLPVEEGDVLRAYYTQQGVFAAHGFRFVCCFDSNKSVLSAKGSDTQTATFTVPSGVSYVRVTLDDNSSKSNHVVSRNISVASYHTYDAPKRAIKDDFLSPESQDIIDALIVNALLSTHLRNNYHCSLPRQALKMTIGLPESFYYWSAMFPPLTTYGYASAGANYCTKHNNKVAFDNNAALTSANGYTWYMYDALFALIDAYTGNAGYGGARSIIAENLSDCSLLAIGDSTVDHDTMTAALLDHFTAQGHTLTLLGTLGSGSNKNEGRAGWKVSDYLTNKQYQSVVNPFYNPVTQTFDFAYYMTNQGYASVDFVVLQMGINDISNGADAPTIWTNLKIIIDSILAYNSSIKILLNLPTTPNSDQSETSTFVMGYLKAVCEYDEYVLAHVLSEYTATNVRTSYCHLILDPDTEIRDNVHPTATGYEKMALEVVNQINHWLNGD